MGKRVKRAKAHPKECYEKQVKLNFSYIEMSAISSSNRASCNILLITVANLLWRRVEIVFICLRYERHPSSDRMQGVTMNYRIY